MLVFAADAECVHACNNAMNSIKLVEMAYMYMYMAIWSNKCPECCPIAPQHSHRALLMS